jgi:hypothetical protein
LVCLCRLFIFIAQRPDSHRRQLHLARLLLHWLGRHLLGCLLLLLLLGLVGIDIHVDNRLAVVVLLYEGRVHVDLRLVLLLCVPVEPQRVEKGREIGPVSQSQGIGFRVEGFPWLRVQGFPWLRVQPVVWGLGLRVLVLGSGFGV